VKTHEVDEMSTEGDTDMAHPLGLNLPTEPKGIEYLIDLALDLRGTWEHSADEQGIEQGAVDRLAPVPG
jgi:hypothetical protein